MSITLTEIITIEEYLSVFPQDASVEEEAIQSAINRATITLDGICGGMIAQVWPVTDPTSTLFRTETEKGYVKQAVALQAQYNVSRNLDFTAGSENYSSGSNNYNETRSRPDLVADETIYQLLAQARVYNPNITTDTTIARTANVGDFYNPSYDPQNDYITYAVGDLRYVLKHFPEGAGRTLGYNLDGNVEAFLTSVSPVANSYVVRNQYGTVKSTEPYDDDDCVTLQYFETHGGQHSGIWGGIQGDINDQLDLKEKLDEKISLLGNEQYSQGPYHFPYHFANLRYDENDFKLKGDLYTITLDNNKTLTNYPLEVQLPKIPTQYLETMTMYGNNLDFEWNDGFTIQYRPNFFTLDTEQTVTGKKHFQNEIIFDTHNHSAGPSWQWEWTDLFRLGNIGFRGTRDTTGVPVACDTELEIWGLGSEQDYVIRLPQLNELTNGKTIALAEDIATTYLSQASASATYLAKSGDTMTGSLGVNAGTNSIVNSVDNSINTICGGTAQDKGASLQLRGKDLPSNPGWFVLTANNGTSSPQLVGKPDNSLKWNGENVLTQRTSLPVLTVIDSSKWQLWSAVYSLGSNTYFMSITVKNISGSAQGSLDYPVVSISGTANDCALATACYEAPDTVIGAVIQTRSGGTDKVIKLRTNGAKIPNGAYIPISGVFRWTA